MRILYNNHSASTFSYLINVLLPNTYRVDGKHEWCGGLIILQYATNMELTCH